MADEIKPCPCGKTPEQVHISISHSGTKWACTYGGCCVQWHPECYALALSAWNENPRGEQEELERIRGSYYPAQPR